MLLGALALSTAAAQHWPATCGTAPRLILSQVPGLSWSALKSQRLLGLRIGTQIGMVPGLLVLPLNLLLVIGVFVWGMLEVAIRTYWFGRLEHQVRDWLAGLKKDGRAGRPSETVYRSPHVESPVASVATGRRPEVASGAPPGAAEAELLEAAIGRLEVDDPVGAIKGLEQLARRATFKMDLVRYYLALAYAANRQPDQVRATMHALPTNAMPPQRRYKLAVMLDQARLYDLAAPLLEGLVDDAKRFPDVVDRLTRVREVMYEGGTEAFDRQLVSMLDPRYEHAKVLASGGMGVVFTAWEPDPGRKVAIKMLSPFLRNDAEAQRRFLREGLTLKELQHPNLVRTFNVHAGPVPHYSMEFLVGGTLADLIAAKAPLPLEQLKNLSLQMLTGLAYCHGREVIHRDIKPANVVVPPAGAIKIIDFGLVKLGLSTGITVEGTVLGTPAYMPPEQLRGDQVDRTADIYSFGIAFYEMATGKLPFPPCEEMTRNIINGTYAPASRLRPELGPEVDALVSRILHRDRAQRPADAGDIAVELGRLLPG